MKGRKTNQHTDSRHASFLPHMRYTLLFTIGLILIILLGGVGVSCHLMKKKAEACGLTADTRITQRLEGSIQLLEALADLPEYYDEAVSPWDKTGKLDQMTTHFGYLTMGYADADLMVYSEGKEPISLSGKVHMEKLYATGQLQVSDRFTATEDGVSAHYMVAVPLVDEHDRITGSLYSSIYFDEITEILRKASSFTHVDITLLGSRGQVMSSTYHQPYGVSGIDQINSYHLFDITVNELQENLLAERAGGFWSFHDGDLHYTTYRRIHHTGWDILSDVRFTTVFSELFPLCMGLILSMVILGLIYQAFLHGFLKKQLLDTRGDFHQSEDTEAVDSHNIVSIHDKGRLDHLSGVLTRSVFLKQAQERLDCLDPDGIHIFLFVDIDNLKYVNDVYGQESGDMALKNIAYILKEYEKKYDGVLGRYEGDEFVMILTGLLNPDEMHSVLDEMILRFQKMVMIDGNPIPMQCSIGATLIHTGMELKQMVMDADEALYYVKQNGKGYYHIHKGRDYGES